jgi:CRISPR-associated protein Cas1
MNPLVIANSFGTKIEVDRRCLVITNISGLHLVYLAHQLDFDSILIDGNYGSISWEAIRFLSIHDIPVSILRWDGSLQSSISPAAPVSSSRLHIQQFSTYQDGKKRLEVSNALIKAKVEKSLEFLTKVAEYYDVIDINRIRQEFSNEYKIAKLTSIENVMLYEAAIAEIYWKNISKIYAKLYPEFLFQKRGNKSHDHNKNASDPLNAMHNIGYYILLAEVKKNIVATGLEPGIGLMHEITPGGRASLAWDLIEIYRWIVDLSILQVLQEKQISKKDFITTEHFHVRCRESVIKKLVERIRINFNKRVMYKGKNHTFEGILLDNTRLLCSYVMNKTSKLEFTVPSMDLCREDNLGIRNKILNINPEERKRLGINKSTLWYQQKYIKEGKKIKVYDKVMNKIK